MPMRRGREPIRSWEVWVQEHDGFVSDNSRVFDNEEKAEAYASKMRDPQTGDYRVSVRPSTSPIPLGRSEASLREVGHRF